MTTSFRNRPVELAALPAVDATPFEPLEPTYLRQQRATWGILFTIVAVVITIFLVGAAASTWFVYAALVIPVALAAAAWILEGLAFQHRGLQLREHDVTSRQGLIKRKTSTAPFVRVQHVTVERGLMDRLFGLATVVVYTAGAASADVTIPGLLPERAEQLREALISRSAAVIGDLPDEPGRIAPTASDTAGDELPDEGPGD